MTRETEARPEAAPRQEAPPMDARPVPSEPPPVPGSPKAQISVRNLDFHYGDFHALKSISMDIFAQRVTAFIGPSGCGKSTLLRVFNRMYSLYPRLRATGQVLLDGKDILASDVDLNLLRAKVGMVFQRATPFPMSIRDNIAFGVRLYESLGRAAMDERVERVLRQAALWEEVKDKLKKNAFSLSGGQQQRLCIARAIAVEPEVILLDEPTSALDPLSTAKIEELLEDLKKRFTIVIVTHNMQQAARVSDSTAFLLDGVLIEYDRTDRLFRIPKDKRTEDYVRGLPPLGGDEEDGAAAPG